MWVCVLLSLGRGWGRGINEPYTSSMWVHVLLFLRRGWGRGINELYTCLNMSACHAFFWEGWGRYMNHRPASMLVHVLLSLWGGGRRINDPYPASMQVHVLLSLGRGWEREINEPYTCLNVSACLAFFGKGRGGEYVNHIPVSMYCFLQRGGGFSSRNYFLPYRYGQGLKLKYGLWIL